MHTAIDGNPAPKAQVFLWHKGACCISWGWAGANPSGDALAQKGGWCGSPAWVLHFLSALFCVQPAEAHCRVPVLARGGLQGVCGLTQQGEN